LSAIGTEKFEGRVWLDLETTSAGAYTGWRNWKIFIETIQAAGLRVGIYSGYYWWKTNAVDAGADLNYFAQFPLWQAWYTSHAIDVLVARGWSSMMIWQHSSTGGGFSAGVESANIDQNKWNDAYNFDSEWTTSPPIGEPMYKYTATALTDGTRLRPAPNVNQTYLASYPAGTKFFGDVKYIAAVPLAMNSVAGDVWIEVNEIQPPQSAVIGKIGWVAVVHQSKAICSLVENTVPVSDSITIDIVLHDVKVAGDAYTASGVIANKTA
jgi:hypothetical protein